MPIILTAMVACDGCGAVLEPVRPIKQADIDGLRWKWTRKSVSVERVRRSTKFYCAACADKPQK